MRETAKTLATSPDAVASMASKIVTMRPGQGKIFRRHYHVDRQTGSDSQSHEDIYNHADHDRPDDRPTNIAMRIYDLRTAIGDRCEALESKDPQGQGGQKAY